MEELMEELMEDKRDNFEEKKIYSYKYFSSPGDLKDEIKVKGRIPECLGDSLKEVIKNSNAVTHKGKLEAKKVLNCNYDNYELVIKVNLTVSIQGWQLINNLDVSGIEFAIYEKSKKEKN